MKKKQPIRDDRQDKRVKLITDWHELPAEVQASFNDCAAIVAPRKRKPKRANADAA